MYKDFQKQLTKTLTEIEEAGLYRKERIIVSPQGTELTLEDGKKVLNFCADNYLGLSNSPELIGAVKRALDTHGYGMSSVRSVCGTTNLHKKLEDKIASFFNTEDTILYATCFDANGGVFESLLSEKDAIISDKLNNASIVDGIRLCKAVKYRYENADMSDLEAQLKKAQKQRNRLIVTDGVFSMDGNVAPLRGIMALAGKYNAMVMVDESHSAGMVGSTGRGITEFFGVMGDVEIMTGTLGKSFGGAMGGFTTGRKEIIEILRQRSRPYLFSNSIPPIVAAAGIKALDIVTTSNVLQDKLRGNTEHFIIRVTSLGFDIKPTRSAICAVMLYDARLSREFAAKLLEEGIYVSGFCYPVVPKGEARIRVQLSAAHTREQIDRAVDALEKIGRQLRAIK
ncbi:MAG TPA: glycine C-acetyltransferase [Bacteroidetes bacterium]|nr:glycine C-acetyltransferase [Bacteroidota bacterium]